MFGIYGAMKKLLPLTLFASSLLTAWASAQAADLPMAPAYKAPVAVQQVYNWTGFYVGVNGGYAWGGADALNIITNRFDNSSTSISGGLFGGTVGAQMQMAHVVMGLEADLDWAGMKGASVITPTIGGSGPVVPFNASTNIKWESTARARVGYASDNVLFYGTAGLALLGAKTTLHNAGRRDALWRCSCKLHRHFSPGWPSARGWPRIWIYPVLKRKNRVSLCQRGFA